MALHDWHRRTPTHLTPAPAPATPQSLDLPRDSVDERITDEEAAEIIREGGAIRTRMERHRVDVEYVLQCNSMLLEWVAMRERLLRQWYRLPAELVAERGERSVHTPQPPAQAHTPQSPQSPQSLQSSHGRRERARTASLSSLPSLGALLQRRRAGSAKDGKESPDASTPVRNGRESHREIELMTVVAGFTRRMKTKRKDCSCICTCGGTSTPTSLKFDDDGVVVLDLHAELIKYDDLLRALKERLDGGMEQAADGIKQENAPDLQRELGQELEPEHESEHDHGNGYNHGHNHDHGHDSPDHTMETEELETLEDEYEADEESLPSPAAQRDPMWPTPRMLLHRPHPWQIPEVSEPDTEADYQHDENERTSKNSTIRGDDMSTIRAANQLPVPPRPLAHTVFVDDDPPPTMSSVETNRTIGMLSAMMDMEARSILGSESTVDTFGRRMNTGPAGEFGTVELGSDSLPSSIGESSRGSSHSESSVPPAVPPKEPHLTRSQGANNPKVSRQGGQLTDDERQRALGGAGRGIRSMQELRNRCVTEFGVRRSSYTAPSVHAPYPTPTVSAGSHDAGDTTGQRVQPRTVLQRLQFQQFQQIPHNSQKLGYAFGPGTLPFSAFVSSESLEDFHPMEQFADASSTATSRS